MTRNAVDKTVTHAMGHTFCRSGSVEVTTCHASGVTFISQTYGRDGMDILRAKLADTLRDGAVIEDDEGGLSFIRVSPYLLADLLEAAIKSHETGLPASVTEAEGFFDNTPRSSITFDFGGTSLLFDANQPYKVGVPGKKFRNKLGVPHAIDPVLVIDMVLNNAPQVLHMLMFEASCMPTKNSKEEKEHRRAMALIDRTVKAIQDGCAILNHVDLAVTSSGAND